MKTERDMIENGMAQAAELFKGPTRFRRMEENPVVVQAMKAARDEEVEREDLERANAEHELERRRADLQKRLADNLQIEVGIEKIEAFEGILPMAIADADGLVLGTFGSGGHEYAMVDLRLLLPCHRCGKAYEGHAVNYRHQLGEELQRYIDGTRIHPDGQCPDELAARWNQEEAEGDAPLESTPAPPITVDEALAQCVRAILLEEIGIHEDTFHAAP